MDREDGQNLPGTGLLECLWRVGRAGLGGARALHRELSNAWALQACAICGDSISTGPMRPLCRACAASMPWWRRADGCPRCGIPSDPEIAGSEASWGGARAGCPACLAEGSPLHRCLAATRHAEPVASLIPAFKNPRGPFGPGAESWRLVDHLADALADRAAHEAGSLPDLVVPIPLHASRLRRRGFNQADLIARRIARRLDRPFAPGLLARVRDTGSQAGLSARMRRKNLEGAFRATARLPEGAARIAVVDDVLTTGSTLESAAEALLAAGAGEVLALTLSATVAPRRARRMPDPYSATPQQSGSLVMRADRRLVPIILVAFAFLIGSGSVGRAADEPAKPDPAFRAAMKRFITVQNIPSQMSEQMTYSAAEQVLTAIASTGATITEPMQTIALDEARKDFGKRFGDVDFLTDLYAEVYVKQFTTQEISTIADFWESSVGKKLLAQSSTLNDGFLNQMQKATEPLAEPYQMRVDEKLREAGLLGAKP